MLLKVSWCHNAVVAFVPSVVQRALTTLDVQIWKLYHVSELEQPSFPSANDLLDLQMAFSLLDQVPVREVFQVYQRQLYGDYRHSPLA